MEPLLNFPERDFQVWVYSVTFRRLLLRSNRDEHSPTRVDVLFQGVEWMSLPAGFHGLMVEAASPEQARSIREAAGIVPRSNSFCFAARGSQWQGHIVATRWDVDEGPYSHDEPDKWLLTLPVRSRRENLRNWQEVHDPILTKWLYLKFRSQMWLKLVPDLGEFTSLQQLDLSYNWLTTLLPAIGRLSQLQELDLSNNSLTTLPPEIGQLSHLQRLNLASNQLTTLPREIGQLSQLQHLDLTNNSLTILPPEIGQLSHLRQLNFSGNLHIKLPPEIGQIPQLRQFYQDYLDGLI